MHLMFLFRQDCFKIRAIKISSFDKSEFPFMEYLGINLNTPNKHIINRMLSISFRKGDNVEVFHNIEPGFEYSTINDVPLYAIFNPTPK